MGQAQVQVADVRHRGDHATLAGLVETEEPRVLCAVGVALGAQLVALDRHDAMGDVAVHAGRSRRPVGDDVTDAQGAYEDTLLQNDRSSADLGSHRVACDDIAFQAEADGKQGQQRDGREHADPEQQPPPG